MSNTYKNIQDIKDAMKNLDNWFPTQKLNYMVSVKLPETGTEVQNFLENSHYKTDDKKEFVIRGTVGETWVIDATKLGKTYTFEDGTPFTKDEFLKRASENPDVYQRLTTIVGGDTPTNYAFKLPSDAINFPIDTSWGDTLYANNPDVPHGDGDFVVASIDENGLPNLNDTWVVNGLVFESTYDMGEYVDPSFGNDEPESDGQNTDDIEL